MIENKAQDKESTAITNQEPPSYCVLLHNDNYTTMDFVVEILKSVFHKPESEAVRVMLEVHEKGSGVCGVYPHEIAEAKVGLVTRLAQENEFPLLCTMEKEC